MKKILTDLAGSSISIVESKQVFESIGGHKGIATVKGEFGRAGSPTQNGRTYPKKLWEREIEKIQKAISEGKVLGHADHPKDGKTLIEYVSHVITDLKIDSDGKIIGEAVLCDNKYGKQILSIIKAGGAVGVSSRGMGSTGTVEGVETVMDDYQYMTHDFVADPAVLTSYPTFKFESIIELSKPLSEAVKGDDMSKEKEVKHGEDVEPKVAEVVKEKPVEADKEDVKQVEDSPAVAEVADEIKTEDSVGEVTAQAVLEGVLETLQPLLKGRDLRLTESQVQEENEKLKDEVKTLKESVQKLGKTCNRLGVQLAFEHSLAATPKEDQACVTMLLGDLSKFESVAAFDKALVEARKASMSQRLEESKKIEAEKQKLLEEAAKVKKYEQQVSALEEDKKKLKEALELTLKETKKLAVEKYVSESLKNHPECDSLKLLAEGISTKEEAEAFVKRHTIALTEGETYNQVRNRFDRVLKKSATLVEDHVSKTSGKRLDEVKGSEEEEIIKEITGL